MKRLLLSALILLCCISQAAARMNVTTVGGGVPAAAAANECDNKILCQNFEGTGYDNGETWAADEGSPNPDSTTSPLRGSQSLRLSASGPDKEKSPNFSAQTTLYGHFLFRFSAAPAGATQTLIIQTADGGADLALAVLYDYGGGDIHFILNQGSVGDVQHSTAMTANTLYHVWFKYVRSTGSNGYFGVWVGTTTSRGDATLTAVSTGSETSSAARIALGSWAGGTITEDFDQVIIDETEFTSVDS